MATVTICSGEEGVLTIVQEVDELVVNGERVGGLGVLAGNDTKILVVAS